MAERKTPRRGRPAAAGPGRSKPSGTGGAPPAPLRARRPRNGAVTKKRTFEHAGTLAAATSVAADTSAEAADAGRAAAAAEAAEDAAKDEAQAAMTDAVAETDRFRAAEETTAAAEAAQRQRIGSIALEKSMTALPCTHECHSVCFTDPSRDWMGVHCPLCKRYA